MNKQEFIEELKKLNLEINEDKLNKLEIYCNYLIEYNKHTNLTSITDIEDIYLKHFYDSLTICRVVDLKNVDSLIDVGTGAGFPGIVIKIMFPHLNVTLLDSNNKKIKFLDSLCNKLNIEVGLINDRCENFSKNNLNKFDIVTSRAVANMRVLSEICLPLVKKDGLFIALKGNITSELEESLETIQLMHSKIKNIDKFNLYQNEFIRNIIVIQKEEESLLKDIRTYDKIVKKPLKKNSK